MPTYIINGTRKDIIAFFSSVQDKEFDLMIISKETYGYHTSKEAIQLLAKVLGGQLGEDFLSIDAKAYLPNGHIEYLWVEIYIKDKYTLHCERHRT